MSEPENKYRKPNNCPYCGYFCDAAMMQEDEKQVPEAGDLSFCLMCCEPSIFGDDMKLQKFDLNSISDIVERNRLKGMQVKMEMFWDANPDTTGRRDQFLKARDKSQ